MFTVIDVPQRSPEWFAARAGRLTSSSADALLAVIQKGEAAKRRNLRTRLVLERLTGKPQDDDVFESDDMRNGTLREPYARDRYEQETGRLVREVGLLVHPELMAGTSPDGLIYHGTRLAGVLECKCRNAANHYESLNAKIPAKAIPQCIHHLWITGAEYLDYVSFHPDFPDHMQYAISRMYTKEFADNLSAYERAARVFLAEVDAEYEKARTYGR
jgi:predicted phage-related endonuclease